MPSIRRKILNSICKSPAHRSEVQKGSLTFLSENNNLPAAIIEDTTAETVAADVVNVLVAAVDEVLDVIGGGVGGDVDVARVVVALVECQLCLLTVEKNCERKGGRERGSSTYEEDGRVPGAADTSTGASVDTTCTANLAQVLDAADDGFGLGLVQVGDADRDTLLPSLLRSSVSM